MSEPIRILIVNYKMQCAGIESFIMNMYRAIDKDVIQFDFLVHYKKEQFYDEEILNMGGNIYRLTVREDNNFLKYFIDLKKFFKIHNEYKIVHGHMESFGIFYLYAAKLAGIQIRIAHSHIAEKNKGLKGTIKGFLNRYYKKYATDLFACSDAAGKFMFGSDIQYKVFNNAIDSHKFKYDKTVRDLCRKELGFNEEQFVIGHIGRFNTQKNHSFLIDIFSEINRIHDNSILLLIGEGDLKSSIKDKVKQRGLEEKVFFLGVRKDVQWLYQAMDVFVMPSLFEGLPVAGIEAQASGLKCIFSSEVTRQTSITSNVEYISLNESPKYWAIEIVKWYNSYLRCDMSKEIIDAGYDIYNQAKVLQDYYLERVNEITNGNGVIN